MMTKFGSNFTVVMRNRSRKGWPGGDMVAMDGFAKALVAVGVNVKNNVSKTGQVVVISWNINYPWVLDHLVQAKAAGHHFLVFAFNMNINDKGYQRLVAEYADGIIFISRAEKDSFETYIGLKVKVPVFYCGIGVNETYISQKLTGKKGVINIGRIERRKNQLNLIQACKKLDLPLTLVGTVSDQEYYQECRLVEGKWSKCRWLKNLSELKLKREYEQAKVIAHPAVFEPWGLTVREGALANCNLVMTQATYAKATFPQVWWVNPKSQPDLVKKLEAAYEQPNSIKNQQFTLTNYSYTKLGQQLKHILEQVAGTSPQAVDATFWRTAAELGVNRALEQEERLLDQDKLIQALDQANRKKQAAIEFLQKSNREKQQALEAKFPDREMYFLKKIWRKIK